MRYLKDSGGLDWLRLVVVEKERVQAGTPIDVAQDWHFYLMNDSVPIYEVRRRMYTLIRDDEYPLLFGLAWEYRSTFLPQDS